MVRPASQDIGVVAASVGGIQEGGDLAGDLGNEACLRTASNCVRR